MQERLEAVPITSPLKSATEPVATTSRPPVASGKDSTWAGLGPGLGLGPRPGLRLGEG